jgi:hypothetical protein
VLVDYVLPQLKPDLAVFWSSDPDTTYHYRGVGSPDSRAALRGADAAFGRVLDWCRDQPEHDRFQIIVVSDHGQLTGTAKVDVIQAMRGAGIGAATRITADAEAGVLPGAMTSVYAREPVVADRIERWLAEQPWCGLILRRGDTVSASAMPMRLVGAEHARAPELAFTFAGSDAADGHGVAGSYVFDGELPIGAGNHGGLHHRELANVLIAGGSAFGAAGASELPAGLLDVAPTIAWLLGLPGQGFDGRVLTEALRRPTTPGDAATDTIETVLRGRPRRFRLQRVGGHPYLGGDATLYA